MTSTQQQQAAANSANASAPTNPSAIQVLTESIKQSDHTLQDTLQTKMIDIMDEVRSFLTESTTEITDKATKKLKTENPTIHDYDCVVFKHCFVYVNE